MFRCCWLCENKLDSKLLLNASTGSVYVCSAHCSGVGGSLALYPRLEDWVWFSYHPCIHTGHRAAKLQALQFIVFAMKPSSAYTSVLTRPASCLWSIYLHLSCQPKTTNLESYLLSFKEVRRIWCFTSVTMLFLSPSVTL